jgi:AraC-like DNA-binding protein
METREVVTDLLFRNDARTPLGRLMAAGYIKDNAGVRGPEFRVLNSYAIVYLLDGSGFYRDTNRHEGTVQSGDLIVLFPDIGHQYGPGIGERWSELYVMFDGPAFDLWRQAGLLNPVRPISRLEPINAWLDQLEATLRPNALTPTGRALELSRFLAVLTEMLAPTSSERALIPEPAWLNQACAMLSNDLGQMINLVHVAEAVGLTYETFRKQFQRATGASPAHYRTIRRIDAACTLLQSANTPIATIGLQLGFSDEYHFSRRFKQIVGLSPREFRRQLPGIPQEWRGH